MSSLTAVNSYVNKYWIVYATIIGTIFSTLSLFRSGDTVISKLALFLVWLFIGVFCSIIWSLFYEEKLVIGKFIASTIFSTIVIGGLVLFSFLAINRSFYNSKDMRVVKLEILSKSVEQTRSGGSFKAAIVKFDGIEKQLAFNNNSIMDNYRSVELTVVKGYFGFYVIKNQNLIKY